MVVFFNLHAVDRIDGIGGVLERLVNVYRAALAPASRLPFAAKLANHQTAPVGAERTAAAAEDIVWSPAEDVLDGFMYPDDDGGDFGDQADEAGGRECVGAIGARDEDEEIDSSDDGYASDQRARLQADAAVASAPSCALAHQWAYQRACFRESARAHSRGVRPLRHRSQRIH